MEHQVGKMAKCFHPQTFNDNVVSCGRCPACKQNRINGWVCRLERHARHQASSLFVTLTYADGKATRTKNGLLTLDYEHVQHFFKSLRNIQNADYKREVKRYNANKRAKQKKFLSVPRRPPKFTYYVAGEYGTRKLRPHYHIILFNASIDAVHRAWCTGDIKRREPRGNVHSGNISGGSIRYTLKYINKPSRLPLFQGDDRVPEFSHMSQGIGKSYITPKIIAWHKADILNRYYVPNAGGVQTTMPRYYAEKIYTAAERIQIAEHLEKQSSETFYKAICNNLQLIDNVLQAQKYVEYKASFTKQYKL